MSDAELRRLAEAATSGPWRTTPSQDRSPDTAQDVGIIADALGPPVPGVRFPLIGEVWAERVKGTFDGAQARADAAYIAAANPTAILDLLDRAGSASDEGSLDAAWAEAESMLPEYGGGIELSGHPDLDYTAKVFVGRVHGSAGRRGKYIGATAATPAAALRALAARLRATPSPSEPEAGK